MTHDDHRSRQEGSALLMVLLVGLVAVGLIMALFASNQASIKPSRDSQDWNASMSAAEAGLDDYIHRLSLDSQYWQYSATPPDGNQAIATKVPLAGGTSEERFQYRVVQTPIPTRPTVRVQVTGTVRGQQRTIEATLRRSSFLDFLYATDFETKDPLLYTGGAVDNNHDRVWAQNNCQRYRYNKINLPARHTDCTKIQFASVDTISGPVHSNDSLLVGGTPTFLEPVTSNAIGPLWVANGSTGTAAQIFRRGIAQRDYMPLPKVNTSLRAIAAGQQAGSGIGCVYTGPTSITLRADGKMDVVSPRTRVLTAGCAVGTGVSLPSNGVIYVQNVPPFGSGDPNANPVSAATCSYKNAANNWVACGLVNGVTYPPGLPVPVLNDVTNTNPVEKYVPENGDVFIKGTLNGKLTVASANDIVVVGDLHYNQPNINQADADDMLGLIPQNSVKIFHPVTSGGSNIGQPFGSDGVSTVSAAMLAVTRSISVQNYDRGSGLGDLRVVGVLGQKYRGIVGTGNGATGYGKDYNYDTRLKVQAPPFFLDPARTAWEVKTWAEVDTPTAHQ